MTVMVLTQWYVISNTITNLEEGYLYLEKPVLTEKKPKRYLLLQTQTGKWLERYNISYSMIPELILAPLS